MSMLLYACTAAGEKPGQLLKKVAQATPKGLRNLFVLALSIHRRHITVQRKFQVDFPRHDRHKADRAALGLSCGVCFEALACVFASAGARLMLVDMEEYRLRQTFVHRKVDYMHSMAY